MRQTWLVLDAHCLRHRAWHTTGQLASGALYGFFRDIRDLRDLFDADKIVFAFDHGYAYRLELLPTYKQSRREPKVPPTEEEIAARQELSRQIGLLRDKYLPALGYRNVLHQRGYEADDMIAAACIHRPSLTDIVIVSSDGDLFQLLDESVSIYNPHQKKLLTQRWFVGKWGLDPVMWASVKAMAGCSSDDIPGIDGIGETYASRYFAGKLNKESKAHAKIQAGLDVYNRNIQLTRLPAPGVEVPQWREDDATERRWGEVTEQLGFKSLKDLRSAGSK